MGLAASQARFLGLTARKSNIEYEGQQVNQQRTALAEEVNSLYSKLLAMDVPVAPDVTEYYETNYSFELQGTSGNDGSYVIKKFYQNDDGTYFLNTEHTYSKNVSVKTVMMNSSIAVDAAGKYTLSTPESETPYELKIAQNSQNMIDLINQTEGEGTIKGTSLYCYQDADGLSHYIDAYQVENYDPTADLNSYISDSKEFTETQIFENAEVVFDENGRFKSISAKDSVTGETIFTSTEIDTTRVKDTEGYDAALRDYTMSKEEYSKAVADLNAQTESLQQEDKVLELRLNQIDTEQNALQTELDAVKSVLDKNIEKTFNTFS